VSRNIASYRSVPDNKLVSHTVIVTFHCTTERGKKLVTLDESAIQDLIGEDEAEKENGDKAASAIQKAKNKVQARLAQERKAAAKQAGKKKKKGGAAVEDDDDDSNLETFAKIATSKKKK